jgi:hypothetical protein
MAEIATIICTNGCLNQAKNRQVFTIFAFAQVSPDDTKPRFWHQIRAFVRLGFSIVQIPVQNEPMIYGCAQVDAKAQFRSLAEPWAPAPGA